MRQLESFFLGIIAALGALFVELVIYILATLFFNFALEMSFTELFFLPQFIIIAAFIEEAFKYLIIAKRVEYFSIEKTYIVNSLIVGAGFAATEFWLLSTSNSLPNLQILLELAIIHLGSAGLMGYLLAFNNPKKISTFFYISMFATFFHASYNFLIQKRGYIENTLIILLLAFLVIANLVNFLRISSKLRSSDSF